MPFQLQLKCQSSSASTPGLFYSRFAATEQPWDFLPNHSVVPPVRAAGALLVFSLATYYLLYARLPHLRTEFFG